MKKIISLLITCLFMIQVQAQELKAKLESAYNSYAMAVKNKDAIGLKTILSSSAYEKVRNGILAQNMKFPDDFFKNFGAAVIDIKQLTYRKSAEKNNASNLIYTGKDPFGDMAVYVFKFVKENSAWKFEFGEDKSTREIRAKISEGDFSFLNSPEFDPVDLKNEEPKSSGKINNKPTAKSNVGYLDVGSENYKLKVTVNENWSQSYEDDITSETIKGLKKGKNRVVLLIQERYAETKLNIKIRMDEKVVFTFSEIVAPGQIEKEFEVD